MLGSIITIIIVMTVVTTSASYAAINRSAFLASGSPTTESSQVGGSLSWSPSADYPTEVWTQSCVASGGYGYCVGGLAGAEGSPGITGAVYYAPLTRTGAGPWTATTSYPEGIRSESCVVPPGSAGATIYCVGGYNSSAVTTDVYFAPLSPSGVGAWTKTTGYPLAVWIHSCAASSDGVYCVGGETPDQASTDAVYFAPYSSTGLGPWTSTTSYPVPVRQESCVTTGGDLYCIGGYQSTSVFFAPLTASGVGAWTNTTVYPFKVGANLLSCTTVGEAVYCVGGHTGPDVSSAVYHAQLSRSGVGPWVAAANYPLAVWGESCVTSGGGIYCTGGETASGNLTSSASYALAS